MKGEAIFLIFVSLFSQSLGHGMLYHPWPWHSTTTPGAGKGPAAVKYEVQAPIPEVHCEGEGCRFHMGGAEWYTNATKRNLDLAPEPTLPLEMYDKWHYESIKNSVKNPWSAPGSAKVFGSCGANGGNPEGCGQGNIYGTCCGHQCGGYEGGKSAILHAADGLFDGAPYKEWKRGSEPLVYWKMGAEHRGGYAYRLCKVPDEGFGGLTEECFNRGHLDFAGKYSWIYKYSTADFDPNKWKQIKAVRTRKGTFPEGSQWAKIELPDEPESGSNWAFKDKVKIPKNLVPGQYVLSFRWDCQGSPQVWQACANINIV